MALTFFFYSVMKLTALIPTQVTLTPDQVTMVTVDHLRSLVSPGKFLQEQLVFDSKLRAKVKKLCLCQLDPEHRHGSISTEVVRPATTLDISVFEVLSHLTEGKTHV